MNSTTEQVEQIKESIEQNISGHDDYVMNNDDYLDGYWHLPTEGCNTEQLNRLKESIENRLSNPDSFSLLSNYMNPTDQAYELQLSCWSTNPSFNFESYGLGEQENQIDLFGIATELGVSTNLVCAVLEKSKDDYDAYISFDYSRERKSNYPTCLAYVGYEGYFIEVFLPECELDEMITESIIACCKARCK